MTGEPAGGQAPKGRPPLAPSEAGSQARRDILDGHLHGCIVEAVKAGQIEDVSDEVLAAAFGGSPADGPRRVPGRAVTRAGSGGPAGGPGGG